MTASGLRATWLNQYAPPDEAATSQLLGDVLAAATKNGMACRVVASDRCYVEPAVRYQRTEVRDGASFSRVRASGFGRSFPLGRAADYVTFLLGAFIASLSGPRPNVVVGMSTPPILGALGVLVARLRGTKSAYWAMDVYPDIAFELGALRETSITGRAFGSLSRWTLRKSDLVIALGETMAERLRAQGARKVVVVHNWSAAAPLDRTSVEAVRFREARGWGGKFVILYSGNMGLAHEFDTLLGAAEVLRDDASVHFAFVGGGPRRDEVEHEAASRALPNISFHPSVSRADLSASLAAADLHVVTLRPGLPGLLVPSKIYGILAAARPALYIGPDRGEVHEIVHECDCGDSVRNGDVTAAVASIRRYQDPREWGWAGARARAMFKARFTKERQTGALLDALEALCRG